VVSLAKPEWPADRSFQFTRLVRLIEEAAPVVETVKLDKQGAAEQRSDRHEKPRPGRCHPATVGQSRIPPGGGQARSATAA
jgi:hypothetical protein